MMRALAALALTACTVNAQPAPAVTLLADVPAWDVEAVAGRMVVIDDGMISVTGFDAATGAKAWSTKVQTQPARGQHGLLINGASAIAWFGDRAHILDGASGTLAASYETVVHGGGCGLWVKDGMCAHVCPCAFTLADCSTGKLVGKQFEVEEVEEVDDDGSMSSGCWGFDGWPLGTAGKLALITVSQPAHTAAVNPATNREVWHRDAKASPQVFATGHSPDGRTCWFTDYDYGLSVLDCATGKLLWKTKGVVGYARHFVIRVAGRGLYDQTGTTATLFAERTGKRLWSVKLPAGVTAWPRGAVPVTDGESKMTTAALLDPATGKIVTRIPLPADYEIVPDTAGAFFIASSTELVAYEAAGTVRARATVPAINMVIGETLVAMGRNPDVVVVDKQTLRERIRVPGKGLSFLVEGALGKGRFVIRHYNGDAIDRVQLYAVTP